MDVAKVHSTPGEGDKPTEYVTLLHNMCTKLSYDNSYNVVHNVLEAMYSEGYAAGLAARQCSWGVNGGEA